MVDESDGGAKESALLERAACLVRQDEEKQDVQHVVVKDAHDDLLSSTDVPSCVPPCLLGRGLD